MCLEASSALSLQLRRIASLQSHVAPPRSDINNAPSEATPRANPCLLKLSSGGIHPTPPTSHLGELENASTAIGIRLKMEHCPGSYREDRFKEDVCHLLAHRPNFVEVIPRTSSHTVQVPLDVPGALCLHCFGSRINAEHACDSCVRISVGIELYSFVYKGCAGS